MRRAEACLNSLAQLARAQNSQGLEPGHKARGSCARTPQSLGKEGLSISFFPCLEFGIGSAEAITPEQLPGSEFRLRSP